MNASIANGILTIQIPVKAVPSPSATGKTLSVASTGGNITTSVMVQGKPVVIGLNAYIKAN
jgi:hypothetical protein